VFVCAVRRATWVGARATLRIAKYVFVTRPLGLHSGPMRTLDAGAGELLDVLGKEGMEEGWIFLDEESEAGEVKVEGKDHKPARGAIAELMRKLKEQDNATEITEEMVELSLLNVGKIAKELKPEEAEGSVEFVDEEGLVFEEAWDKTVEKAEMPRTTSPHPEDQEFVMV
jgi:hypothetical protein